MTARVAAPTGGGVTFVSAGMFAPKKRDHALARRQRYLNYGALSLATRLAADHLSARVVHGGHEDPAAVVESLVSRGDLETRSPIMLSVPSFHALGWARRFSRVLKVRRPAMRLIVGGRWVVGGDPSWLAGMIPEADVFVSGLAEDLIAKLADPTSRLDRFIDGGAARDGAGRPSDLPLDHRLVDGYEAFQPSIEASQGCGMKCAFCEERDILLSALKDPGTLADHLVETVRQYGDDAVHPYLQSSFFLPNPRWAKRFAEATHERGLGVTWRTETRVDAILPETIGHLAAAGMKVVDLGLESASPRQLLRMGKSGDPAKYLRAAAGAFRACRDNGIWAKVNILLYAGETSETLAETREWMDAHADCIKGVSVGPVVAYGPPSQSATLISSLEAGGAAVVDKRSAFETGITAMHPSAEIDADAAEALSLDMSRRMMSAEDYFDLKSFSYYPRGYGLVDFQADVALSEVGRLPFAMG